MEYELRPALRERNPEECDQLMKQMWKQALSGKSLFTIMSNAWPTKPRELTRPGLLSRYRNVLDGFSVVGHGQHLLSRTGGGTESHPPAVGCHPRGPRVVAHPDGTWRYVAACDSLTSVYTANRDVFCFTAYNFIVWRIWLHRCLDGSEKEFMLKRGSPFGLVPQVVPRPGGRSTGGQNGHVGNKAKRA